MASRWNTTPKSWVGMKHLLLGLSGSLALALAFPFKFPGLGTGPHLDLLPREALAPLGVAALYCCWRQSNRPGWHLYGFGVVHYSVLLFWLWGPLAWYGGVPGPIAALVVALLAFYCAIYWGLTGSLATKLYNARRVGSLGGWAEPCSFTLAWMVAEFLRGVLLTGFPWGAVGYSQARNLWLLQWAELGGVQLVGAWVLTLSVALATVRSWRGRLIVGIVALTVHSLGAVRLSALDEQAGTSVTVGILQGGIGQDTKNTTLRHLDDIAATYRRLTAQAVRDGADFLLWPETSYPAQIAVERDHIRGLRWTTHPSLVGVPVVNMAARR